MQKELYSFIKSHGNFSEDKVLDNPFISWHGFEIERFVLGLVERIRSTKESVGSHFDFCVNSTLSGGPYPCSSLECRMKNIDNLSRFAAFYAENVLVKSPIDKHYSNMLSGKEINRNVLYIDILILLRLEPLVRAGIVNFTSSHLCLCEDCSKGIVMDETIFHNKLSSLREKIEKDCLDNIKCTLQTYNNNPYLAITGAEKYGYHTQTHFLFNQDIPTDIKKIWLTNKKNDTVLTKKMIEKLSVLNYILGPSLQDLYENNIYSARSGASYLTNKDFDVEMINLLHTKESLNESKKLTKNLFHKVPLLENIDINDIVNLRCKDGDSFKVYRDSINKVLSERPILDEKSMLDLQKDIIMPEINRINLTIKNNKKALLGSLASEFVFWGAGISIGIFSGLLPLNLVPVVSAIGGMTTVKDAFLKTKDVILPEASIRNENYYFLWKLLK